MWLASVSVRRRSDEIVSTDRWATRDCGTKRAAEKLLDDVLHGVGNPDKERQFRMSATLCRHRALTTAEFECLPKWWHDAPSLDTAGPPIEVMWTRGIPEILSTLPCRNPGKSMVDKEIYIVVPCNQCDTCVARNTAEDLARRS